MGVGKIQNSMNNNGSHILATVLFVWTGVIIALFLQVAGIFELKLLQFPIAKGNLLFFREYKAHNILAKGQVVISIPHGIPFVHPARTEKLDELNIHRSFTIDEATSLVDGKPKTYTNLNIVYKKILLLQVNDQIFGVPAVNSDTGNIYNLRDWAAYSSRFLGASVADAKVNIDKFFEQ